MYLDYSKRIFGLDVMRATAILLVVFSHVLWIMPDTKGLIPDMLSLAGVIGVEIFFVLSGFLIGRIVLKMFLLEDFNFKKVLYFWIRRWFRTLPNYYLILVVNILLMLVLGYDLPHNLWHYFVFIQNLAWEMPFFFSESWSLPIEEFAYILGPLLLYLVFLFKVKQDKTRLFAMVTLFIIVFFTVTKIIYNFKTPDSDMLFWNVNLKSVTLYRIDAIYYGMLASYFAYINPKKWHGLNGISFVIGIIIFTFLNFIIPNQRVFIGTHPFFWNVIYLPLNSIAIAFCLPLLSQLKKAPGYIIAPVTFISVISYSMYLLHYSIILQLLKRFVPTDGLSIPEIFGYILLYIVSTILLSFVMYKIYEKPMMDIRDKSFIRNRLNQY